MMERTPNLLKPTEKMITQQQRDLRNAIVEHAEKADPDMDPTTTALISVLGSVIEGIPVKRALGSPGNWGYGKPIGDALLELLKSSPELFELDAHADLLYSVYCEGVGGVAFNGDPLPSWADFAGDAAKQKQADAWRAVAKQSLSID